MKRAALALALACLAGAASALDVRLGLTGFGGLLYNGEPTFSVTGSAAQVLLEGPGEWLPIEVPGLRPEAGLELAAAGLGAQVLAPLGVNYKALFESGWSVNLSAHGLVGLALLRSGADFAPQGLFGAEAEVRLEWSWEPGVALGLSSGLRFTASPGYSAAVAPYQVLEAPVRLDFEFAVSGPEIDHSLD